MTAIEFNELISQIPKEPEEETFVKLKDHKYVIVSKVAYLIGVQKKFCGPSHNFDEAEYIKLDVNKNARIIRNLCIIRNDIERGYKAISYGFFNEHRSVLGMTECISQDAVRGLYNDGVKLTQKPGTRPIDYVMEINTHIKDRINNCSSIFPTWLNWNYIKELFIMPDGTTEAGCADAAAVFYENLRMYPYSKYINWNPVDEGNILRNDKAFVNYIYSWHEDEFPAGDQNKLMDASSFVKSNIYKFLDDANGDAVDMIVDCENSDVYNIISMFSSLEKENYQGKISKIILVNDVHTNLGWQQLERCTDIPVEHIMTQRIKEDKSLVDGSLIVKICEEFFAKQVKSFILLSSDSDFWCIMNYLKGQARFLVMVEHEKVGPDLKRKLEEELIFYCYLDDFYAGEEADSMKNSMLLKYVANELVEKEFNISQIFDQALMNLRINLTEAQKKQFYTRYLKKVQLDVDEKGKVSVKLKGSAA